MGGLRGPVEGVCSKCSVGDGQTTNKHEQKENKIELREMDCLSKQVSMEQ